MRSVWIALLSVALVAAVPRHVQTADYFGGYSGTKTVPASRAAPLLNWAETDQIGSMELAPLHVKPILYSNPNIETSADPIYRTNDSGFLHTCSGERIRINDPRNFYIMNPQSRALRQVWRQYVDDRTKGARFAAVFEDQAIFPSAYHVELPCAYNPNQWLDAAIEAQRDLGYPVIYNGLSDYYNHGVAREIALNATAIGGMMEQCYSTSPPHPVASGWQWVASENTELRMARDRKYFFCLGNDNTAAEQAYDQRIYVDASFLLTYDPNTSVLMEFYHTPSGLHVLPESEIVPWDPVRRRVSDVNDLRTHDGAYVREYRRCYVRGHSAGACAIAVNPDEGLSVPLRLSGYTRLLTLQGSGIYDGGKMVFARQPLPRQLNAMSAVIAVK